jgi:hypothetical protein
MKMTKLALAIVVAGATSAGIVGCHDSKDRHNSVSTTIDVFDGYALNCNVTANGIAAEEVGNGEYTVTSTQELPDGAVVSATDCVDADTGAQLPTLQGVAQQAGVAVSPITTLIVAAALASGGDPANLTAEAIQTATTAIVEKLGLGSYDPINPATANYVDDVGTNTTSQAQMQLGLAITTLLKTIEKAAGDDSDAAITALATAILDDADTIDLSDVVEVQALMTSAASQDETVATALETASDAAADKVAQIAGADSVGEAAAITQAIAQVLDDEEASVDDVADVDTEDLDPIDVGVVTDPDTGETGSTGGTGG